MAAFGGLGADRNRVVEENIGLAYSEAARSCWRGRGLELDDLRAEARVGLMAAADKFDPSRGNRFSTYAVPCIRRALMDALHARDEIRVPRGWAASRREALREMDRAEGLGLSAEARLGEAARRMGTSAGKVRGWLSLTPRAERLSTWPARDGEECGRDIPDRAETPEESLVRREREDALRSALRRLRGRDPRGWAVLARHRGLLSRDGSGEPFSKIGRDLGMTRQNACAIERRALRSLAADPSLMALAE